MFGYLRLLDTLDTSGKCSGESGIKTGGFFGLSPLLGGFWFNGFSLGVNWLFERFDRLLDHLLLFTIGVSLGLLLLMAVDGGAENRFRLFALLLVG